MSNNLVLPDAFQLMLVGDANDEYTVKIARVNNASIVIEDGVATIDAAVKDILYTTRVQSGLVPIAAILGEKEPFQLVAFSESLDDLEKKLGAFLVKRMRISLDRAIELLAEDGDISGALKELDERFDELSPAEAAKMTNEMFSRAKAEMAYIESYATSQLEPEPEPAGAEA